MANCLEAASDAVKWTDVGIYQATVALAIVTGLLFVATFAVALWTAILGRDTVEATKLADRHHQESLNPQVFLDGISVRTTGPQPAAPPYTYLFEVDFRIENVGLGPAVATLLELTVNGMKDGENLGHLGAGAFRPGPKDVPAVAFRQGPDGAKVPVLRVTLELTDAATAYNLSSDYEATVTVYATSIFDKTAQVDYHLGIDVHSNKTIIKTVTRTPASIKPRGKLET